MKVSELHQVIPSCYGFHMRQMRIVMLGIHTDSFIQGINSGEIKLKFLSLRMTNAKEPKVGKFIDSLTDWGSAIFSDKNLIRRF